MVPKLNTSLPLATISSLYHITRRNHGCGVEGNSKEWGVFVLLVHTHRAEREIEMLLARHSKLKLK
jgi:hypothetical protein